VLQQARAVVTRIVIFLVDKTFGTGNHSNAALLFQSSDCLDLPASGLAWSQDS
jgi:hypothetical protein